MALELLDLGSQANAGDGDTLRDGGTKLNNNTAKVGGGSFWTNTDLTADFPNSHLVSNLAELNALLNSTIIQGLVSSGDGVSIVGQITAQAQAIASFGSTDATIDFEIVDNVGNMLDVKLAEDAVDTIHIKDDAVTLAKLASEVTDSFTASLPDISNLPSTAADGTTLAVLGYRSSGDGGGGLFRYDASGNASEHNGVTAFDPNHNLNVGDPGYWTAAQSASGVWRRVVQETLDAREGGCLNDGAYNNYEALNATLLAAKGIAPVFLSGGVFVVDGAGSELSLHSDLEIRFANTQVNATNCGLAVFYGVDVDNVTFNGRGIINLQDPNTNRAVYILGAASNFCDNISISGLVCNGNNNVNIGPGTLNIHCIEVNQGTNVRIINCSVNNHGAIVGQYAFGTVRCHNWVMSGCISNQCPIGYHPVAATYGAYQGCFAIGGAPVNDNGWYLISSEKVQGTPERCEHITFNGCHSIGMGTGIAFGTAGTDPGGLDTDVTTVRDISVTGCSFVGNTGNALSLRGCARINVDGCLFINNGIAIITTDSDSYHYGLDISNCTCVTLDKFISLRNTKESKITDCTVRANTSATTLFGAVQLIDDTDQVDIRNIDVYGPGSTSHGASGYAFNISGSLVKNVRIDGCYVDKVNQAFRFLNVDFCSVRRPKYGSDVAVRTSNGGSPIINNVMMAPEGEFNLIDRTDTNLNVGRLDFEGSIIRNDRTGTVNWQFPGDLPVGTTRVLYPTSNVTANGLIPLDNASIIPAGAMLDPNEVAIASVVARDGVDDAVWHIRLDTAPNVPDGSITTDKLADDAVTSAKILNGEVKNEDLESMPPWALKLNNAGFSGSPGNWRIDQLADIDSVQGGLAGDDTLIVQRPGGNLYKVDANKSVPAGTIDIFSFKSTVQTDNTGATDASADIQAAIDATHAAGGGTVNLGPGIYKIDTRLTLKETVHLVGKQRRSTFLTRGAATGAILWFEAPADGVVHRDAGIHNLTLDAANTDDSVRDLVILTSDNGEWADLEVTGLDVINAIGPDKRNSQLQHQRKW